MASVFLFRYAAGLVVRGVPLLLAVAIFAVSFHPIRHAADVKPYASDLLVALALLTPALCVVARCDARGRLWILAAIVPIALALSHPAVFVAGGIALGLGPAVLRAPRRGVIVAYGAFVAALGATFVGLYAMFTQAQSSATLSAMQAQWGKAFPPLGNPAALVGWLAQVHTGSMFAYPCGGDGGASILTFALFAAGVFVLCRRGRAEIAAVCLAPFGLALVAAALKRYPYGGVAHGSPARVMQYLVPAICLLTGVGAAALLTRLRSAPTSTASPPRRSRRAGSHRDCTRRDRRLSPVPRDARPDRPRLRPPILARGERSRRAGLPALGFGCRPVGRD